VLDTRKSSSRVAKTRVVNGQRPLAPVIMVGPQPHVVVAETGGAPQKRYVALMRCCRCNLSASHKSLHQTQVVLPLISILDALMMWHRMIILEEPLPLSRLSKYHLYPARASISCHTCAQPELGAPEASSCSSMKPSESGVYVEVLHANDCQQRG
jgi:hypothetical protein